MCRYFTLRYIYNHHTLSLCGMELHRRKSTLKTDQWLTLLERISTGGDCKDVCNLLFNGEELDFLKTKWEKSPVLFSNVESDYDGTLDVIFSKSALISTCESLSIRHGNNINVVKYLSGVKTAKEYPYDAPIHPGEIKKLFKKGYTLQFFQPQRFSDSLHSICAGLERLFGTLAGSSAYLTPPLTQGLAPHWDDVDVFVLQTEGMKLWHLWAPTERLSEVHSPDLSRAALGPPALEVTLQPGDVLYLPRGTIHEAIALESFSTHVTISVYQKYNLKSLIEKMMPSLLDKLFSRCDGQHPEAPRLDVRRGLPVQMSSLLGTFAAISAQDKREKKIPVATQYTALPDRALSSSPCHTDADEWRRGFLEDVVAAVSELGKCVTAEDIDMAADLFGEDFCRHRLPDPSAGMTKDHGGEQVQVEDEEALHSIVAQCRRQGRMCLVRLCDPSWLHVTVEEVDGVVLLLLGSGKDNNRMNHMGHPSVGGDGSDDGGSDSGGSDAGLDDAGSVEEDDEDDWVITSLPYRAHTLVRLLCSSYNKDLLEGCLSYEQIIDQLGPTFSEEEVSTPMY